MRTLNDAYDDLSVGYHQIHASMVGNSVTGYKCHRKIK